MMDLAVSRVFEAPTELRRYAGTTMCLTSAM